MKKRGRFTRTEILKLLTHWKRSGITKRQFCRNENIAHSTFANWYKKYRQDIDQPTESDPLPAFIPIKLDNHPPPGKSAYSPIEVSFPNGVQLRCTSDIDFNDLKLLIQ